MQEKDKAISDSDIHHMKSLLCSLDEAQMRLLLGVISSYVQNMGLATGYQTTFIAQEVLQETIILAITHANRFDPSRQLRPWLLGIALNLIRHKRAEAARRQQREFSLSQLSWSTSQQVNENELLDQLIPSFQESPETLLLSQEQIHLLFSLVSAEDQHILRLVFLEDFSYQDLAQQLGVTMGAARVRLHRALARLRVAWTTQQAKLQKGTIHE